MSNEYNSTEVGKLRNDHRPIFLTGFMGVGKSSVGILLATLLNKTFHDVDKMAEASVSMTIAEMFAKKGESFFRDLEAKTIEGFTTSKDCVISLGGGALMNSASLQTILTSGILIYLSASEETLAERIASQHLHRPILDGLAPEEKKKKISELLTLRMDTYKKAHYQIETDRLSIDDVVKKIVRAMGKGDI